MTPNEKRLLVALLQLAADEFSNKGCNDFNMTPFLSSEERDALVFEAHGELHGDGQDPDYRLGDWELMQAMADKLSLDIDGGTV